jgi:hypothetical protein
VPKGFIALFAQHENVHAIKPDKEDPAREAVKEGLDSRSTWRDA